MRGLRGHIINLADGLGPPAGTVDVNAKVSADNAELDNTTHRTGKLNLIHLIGGSGSPTKADPDGHWGWDFELSPGQLTQLITPHDPQTEHRKRFPDESSQIGKAFFTDLERLGWAAGKDVLVWDAIQGGHAPTSWSGDPALTYNQGNWSVGAFGSGADAMRVLLRRGIGFVAGVPFSIELADLLVPVAGETLPATNPSGSPRWDLLCLRVENDSSSVNYGKQSFEIIQGTPGAGIPPNPGNPSGARRLPIHALFIAAGGVAYSNAYDLRRWANPPPAINPSPAIGDWNIPFALLAGGIQTINSGVNESILNSTMAARELVLSPNVAWDGYVTWNGILPSLAPAGILAPAPLPSSVLLTVSTEGRINAGDAAIAGTNFVADPAGYWLSVNATGFGSVMGITIPLNRIPAYPAGRSWSRLRIRAQYSLFAGPAINIVSQRMAAHLWPVP